MDGVIRETLERLVPPGPYHAELVATGDAAWKIALAAVLFLLVRWMALRALRAVMWPLEARAIREGGAGLSRLRTLEGLARSTITYLLLFITGVTLLAEFRINVATILAGAGVAGLALSFGAQRLVRDVLTGAFLLLEDQFRVGETVTLIGGPGLPQITGTILDMGLRVTRLHDDAGKLVTIGNGDIAAVINHSRGPILATVEVAVSPDAPLERLRELAAGLELPGALFAGPATLRGVAALEAGKRVVRVAAPAQPGKAPEAELALREALGEALRRAGIELR